jgi:hypothetical protein
MPMHVSPVALLLLAALGIGGEHARAESYPSRPVRIVVPFAAGGALDVLARLIGGKLSDAMGQPVIVENRAGANGTMILIGFSGYLSAGDWAKTELAAKMEPIATKAAVPTIPAHRAIGYFFTVPSRCALGRRSLELVRSFSQHAGRIRACSGGACSGSRHARSHADICRVGQGARGAEPARCNENRRGPLTTAA